jgi:DNA excision repair protein ERCC-6-like 2
MVFTESEHTASESEDDALDSMPAVRRKASPGSRRQITDFVPQREPKRRRISPPITDSDGLCNDEPVAASKTENANNSVGTHKPPRKSTPAQAARASSTRPHGNGKTGVGKRAPRRRKIKERNYGDSTSEDDELMEWTMPDYLQKRRTQFDVRKEKLKEGGLSLPPEYDDIYFSDDDRLEYLKEKPDLPLRSDAGPYKDIELVYSLGIIPASIAQHLRPYQVQGAQFLHELFVYQKGGILGDDMGLGKTIQVIAFLTAAFGKTGDERDRKRMRKIKRADRWYPRVLIICPGSLMANWEDELQRWGWWHVDVYHGIGTVKDDMLQQAQSGRLEIMITTYDTYRLSASKINMVSWDCVIADECHKIKERKSHTTKILNEVNALCRVGLTGTAIQNNYEEFWTLLNWTNPGRLGPVSQWKSSVCVPLKLGQSHNASNYELARARKTAKMLATNLLPQFFLRRTKDLIKDQLPKKTDRVVFCPLTNTQAFAYQNFLDHDIVQYIKDSSQPCACSSGKGQGWCCKMEHEDGSRWQEWVFPAMTVLRNMCNHLAVLIPQGNDSKDKQAKALEMLQIALPDTWKKLYRERDSMLHTSNVEFCGKWKVLRKLLKFWFDEGNNKVLVFSHSVRLLRMLQNLFISTSYNVSYLDGSMKYEERYATVNEFNSDPRQFVFLISTKAGGVGLNITSANKVVVVDPNWNPAYDLQAQDRAYRIGQTRDVEVFRLVSQGTIEEIVYARQIYKQQQASIGYNASTERRYFQGVQDMKGQKGEIFGLQNLFAWHNENIVLRDIVNKTNVAESKAGLHIANLKLEDDEAIQEDGASSDEEKSGPSIKSEDDPDAAMSQLAAEVLGDDARPGGRNQGKLNLKKAVQPAKHDPIIAILSSVGVSYTHENSEVIGSSKVENELSRAAEAAAANESQWDASQQQRRVFLPETQTQESPSRKKHKFTDAEGEIRYRYRPSEDVMRRQFGAMALHAGFGDDVVGFALLVESWTQKERREWLEAWYRHRRDVLEGLADDHVVKDDTEDLKFEVKQDIKPKKKAAIEVKAPIVDDESTDDEGDGEL